MDQPTLRARIEAAILQHCQNIAQAALAVCLVLNDELDLQGNGWFDNDPTVLDALKGEEQA